MEDTILHHLHVGMRMCRERADQARTWMEGTLPPALELVRWFDYGEVGWDPVNDCTLVMSMLEEGRDAGQGLSVIKVRRDVWSYPESLVVNPGVSLCSQRSSL